MNRRVPIAIVSCLVACASCRDITPIRLEEHAAPTTVDDGGATRDAEGDINAKCFACISAPLSPGPGCGDIVSQCRLSATCSPTLDCGEQSHCFVKTLPSAEAACGQVCAAANGLTSLDDPAINLLLTLIKCAGSTCAAACGHSDDAGP